MARTPLPIRSRSITACAIAACTIARAALAAPLPAVALSSFAVRGASGATEGQLRDALVGGLAAAGRRVLEGEAIDSIGPELKHCDTPTCAARVGELTGAAEVARADVAVSGSSYAFELSLADGHDGHKLAALHERCEVCNLSEASAKLSALGRALFERAAKPAEKPVAPTPPPPAPKRAAEPKPPMSTQKLILHWGKWVVAAGALALVTLGLTQIGVDGHPTLGCSPPNGGECPMVYDTRLEGSVFLILGIVAAIGSGAMFALDRPPKLAPTASVSASSATLGIAGTF